MRSPLVGMLLGVPAGCIAGGVSMMRFLDQTFGQLAVISGVVVMFFVSLVLVAVAFVTYRLCRFIATRASVGESNAVVIGYTSSVIVASTAVAVAALSHDWFSAENYLWPTTTALAGTLVGGAVALLLRNEPRIPMPSLD